MSFLFYFLYFDHLNRHDWSIIFTWPILALLFITLVCSIRVFQYHSFFIIIKNLWYTIHSLWWNSSDHCLVIQNPHSWSSYDHLSNGHNKAYASTFLFLSWALQIQPNFFFFCVCVLGSSIWDVNMKV